jgi:undecaprenyl diphosphate synthase
MEHLAIIMDGNRRFAKKSGLPNVLGHESGAKKIIEVCEFAKQAQIKFLTLFAFSSENWKREPEEVANLINLLEKFLKSETKALIKNEIKVLIIGDKTSYSKKLQSELIELENKTSNFKNFTLIIALNYGGRAEIVSTVNKLLQSGITSVTEESFQNSLFTAEIPDPDLLIRTGGDKRISNFLLWQLAYTELYFTETLWPEFQKQDFQNAVNFFHSQKRNFGK